MSDSMDLPTALSTAERMKGFFRAFEKLEKFCEWVRDKESQKARMESEISQLDASRVSLQDQINSLDLVLGDKELSVSESIRKLDEDLEKKKSEISKKIASLDSEFGKRHEDNETALAYFLERSEGEKRTLEMQLNEKRKELATLQEAIVKARQTARVILGEGDGR